jgi:hypothetical protein
MCLPCCGSVTILDLQPLDRRLQVLGRHLQQHGSGFGAGSPQDGPELPHRKRSEGAHIPGALVGVAHDHVYGVQAHIEFIGQQLRQRSHDPLAHLDLAHQASDAPIRSNPKVGVEIGRVARAGGRALRFLQGREGVDHAEDKQPRTEREELATAQVRRIGRLDTGLQMTIVLHDAPPFMAAAASWMASTMRLYAPQRQRLSSMPWRISARVGRAVRSSSA